MLSPVVDEIANERTDVKVGKVNVDEQEELAAKFGIMSIPTLIVFKNGKPVRQGVGVQPKAAILDMLNG
jgi:thioredoxin 1